MKRIQRKIKFEKKTWTISAIAPADFLELSYWPFTFYRLSEEQKVKAQPEVKRDWKLKPQPMISLEDKLEASTKHALKLGLNLKSDAEYNEINVNEPLKNLLLFEIYALTYELSAIEKYFTPFKFISRDFAEGLAVKSKALGVEPYSFLNDVTRETPELYNPKRYDFNWFVLGIGWDKERREIEKAQAEAKAKYATRKR